MSAAAAKWARVQVLPQTEKAVLKALADAYSPRWGYSGPSQKKVAAEIGVSRETVNRALARLVSKGLITAITAPRKKGQWERCVYTLALYTVAQDPEHRVTQDHTGPCDLHQTRRRVTHDHTSRIESSAGFGVITGGRASA